MTTKPALSAVEIAEALGRPRPTDEQAAVIEAPLEPLLVVAGAGSGKTETMAARVVWLVANRLVRPERVLGLTFTRKAAGELSERVRHRLRALRRATGGGRGASRLGELSVPSGALTLAPSARTCTHPFAPERESCVRWPLSERPA